jgi:glycerol-3-phosphate acyltransferase PlsX
MIAVDVMGGDFAPHVVLQGALSAAQKSIPIALYGPQSMIVSWLDAHDPVWMNYAITIVDAPDAVGMDEEPVLAVRKKPMSSLVMAATSVALGQCSAVLSAGNSGALMAAATFLIGRADGVERPAIAGFMPTLTGETLLLDLGANTDCRPVHLQQFAHMGNAYFLAAKQSCRPRVALLSNGHEEGKGSLLVKETFALLKNDSLNFIGNVEPADIFAGKADVVVCDGFAGNVLLKTMEAVADMVMGMVGVHEPIVVEHHLTYKKHGGAVLLGVKKPVIVCHGNSDAKTIENAIVTARNVSACNNLR